MGFCSDWAYKCARKIWSLKLIMDIEYKIGFTHVMYYVVVGSHIDNIYEIINSRPEV